MTETPKYHTVLYNDAAIAVGVWVEGAAYAPYNGFLAAAAVKGAGIEDGQIRTSAGDPIQHIPGRDIAVDSDTLTSLTNDPLMLTLGGNFCIFNMPVQKNTRIDVNYPNGNPYMGDGEGGPRPEWGGSMRRCTSRFWDS